jgi:tRNA(fMet)-specific endonuclease VapC
VILVDSSVFVTLDRRAGTVEELPVTRDTHLVIATVMVSELLTGAFSADTVDRRLRRERFLEAILVRCQVVPFDLDTARAHARLWADLRAQGNLIGRHDLIIAATALALDHDLMTENVREFLLVPGLRVTRPNW